MSPNHAVTARAVDALLAFGLTDAEVRAALRMDGRTIRRALRAHGDPSLLGRYLRLDPEPALDVEHVLAMARRMLSELPAEDKAVVRSRHRELAQELSVRVSDDGASGEALKGPGGVVRWRSAA